MEFKGTKGKWVNNNGNIVDENNIEVVDIITLSKEDEANALLISKAPEMLEMIELLIDRLEENDLGHLNVVERAKQLIKEATEL